MNMSIAHSGNASCHKVPDSYATIVATYSQQCATSVECTRESLTARIQDTIIVLPTVKKEVQKRPWVHCCKPTLFSAPLDNFDPLSLQN